MYWMECSNCTRVKTECFPAINCAAVHQDITMNNEDHYTTQFILDQIVRGILQSYFSTNSFLIQLNITSTHIRVALQGRVIP